MTPDKFIDFVKEELGYAVHKSGSLLYSSFKTLKKGKYLILGLNPGGDPEEKDTSTIRDSLEKAKDNDYNAYYEDWNDGKVHPLQENLKAIAGTLGMDLRDICATNLIYTRSRGEKGVNWDDLDNCLRVLDKILEIVRPEIILTFGKAPFVELRKFYQEKNYHIHNLEPECSGHGRWTIRRFEAHGAPPVKVIGLPHLSRYHIRYKKDRLNWLKVEVNS